MEGYYHPSDLDLQLSQQPAAAPSGGGTSGMNPPMDPVPSSSAGASQHPVAMSGIVHNPSMGGGDSLDDIIQNNQRELRRSSMPPMYGNDPMAADMGPRRVSTIGAADMMNFGGTNQGMGDFQFHQPLSGFLQINTDLAMSHQMASYMPGSGGDYTGIPPDMMGNMIPSTFANMNMGQMPPASSAMDLYSPDAIGGQYNAAQQMTDQAYTSMAEELSMNLSHDAGQRDIASSNATPIVGNVIGMGDNDTDMMGGDSQTFRPMDPPLVQPSQQQDNMKLEPNPVGFNHSMGSSLSPNVGTSIPTISPQGLSPPGNITQHSSSDANTPASASVPREAKEKTIYSKSGFDMLKALWLVATRKEPKIHLGAVDMSCAFVVCDVTMNDCPIIYVSDNFQNLTGYSRHEIVGQNCRFLQAPDGKVEAGSRREFVDDGAVYNLKKMIHEGREVQQSLINYRKGGKPFLNLLTMIPIPWDTDDIRYFIGFQIDLVECPDAISGQEMGGVQVNYKHSDIGQYIWSPPASSQWEPENGQTLGIDDVSTLLQQFNPKGLVSDWHKQSWDKMLLENTDDLVHVLSLKGLFLYLSPACKRVLEYDAADLAGNSLSSICHPSDIVPVTRELKDTAAGNTVNIVFRIRRKYSGYTWFESHGSLFVEQGKGRKCIILVGRKRPVFALSRHSLEANGGIGDSELWTKLSTSGMFLFVSSNVRSLLDLQPESLVGTSIQDLMRKETRSEFGRAVEKARRGRIVTCKHEVQNRRGQVLQAQTVLYPGDASEGRKPSFLLAQTKLLKASSRSLAPARAGGSVKSGSATPRPDLPLAPSNPPLLQAGGEGLVPVSQDAALASDDNVFDELRTTKCSSWQFELRQMEKVNRILAEELGGLLSNKKKRKRRKGVGNLVRDCANCHTRNTPEWRRGPSGQRDLCNSCGLRWAKQTGRVSPRNSSRGGNGDGQSKKSASPLASSPLHKEFGVESSKVQSTNGGGNINPAQLITSNADGAKSATSMMPPPSQPKGNGNGSGDAMPSIREERGTSQP